MSERKIHTPTDEESARWRQAMEEELLAKPDNVAYAKRFRAALAEQSISGQLRRAIVGRRIPLPELAQQSAVPLDALEGFLDGERTLESDAFARLAAALRYELVEVA